MLKPVPLSEVGADDRGIAPHNYVAEQSLLGALLMRGKIIERTYGFLRGEHFAEPLHGRIYEAVHLLVERGSVADAQTVRHAMGDDGDLETQGGHGYLGRLIGAATTTINAVDYARLILDAHLKRALIGLGETIISAAHGASPASEQIVAATQTLDDLGRQIGQDGLRGVDDYRGDVQSLYRGERKAPLSTGFASLDRFYRIRPGDFTVVTGAPSSGKSQLVDAIAMNLALREGHKFAICSFENSPDEHIAKLCQAYVGLPFFDRRSGRMNEAELEDAMNWVAKHFHFIRAERDSPTINWALARAKAAVDRHGINGLILDPYNRFEHKRPAGMNEAEYLSQSLSSVQRFASTNKVHTFFVAHPAKPQHDRRDQVPSLYDISGGAHWANICDVGLSIDRPFLPDGTRSREIECHVKKARFRAIGQPGVAKLKFDPATGRYSEVEPTEAAPHWTDEP